MIVFGHFGFKIKPLWLWNLTINPWDYENYEDHFFCLKDVVSFLEEKIGILEFIRIDLDIKGFIIKELTMSTER